jgi:hypothetical protein
MLNNTNNENGGPTRMGYCLRRISVSEKLLAQIKEQQLS